MPSLFAIRQAESTPVPNSTAKPNDPNALFTVIAAVVGVAAVLVLLLAVARLYVVRRRRAALATGQNASLSPNPATATATVGVPDHFLFSGGSRTTQQPPMVVRMQRHIQANGLSVEELDKIAPVKLSRPDEMPDVRDASPGSTTSECVQDDCTCPVCLEEMSPDDKVRRMPCTHTFHAQCIEEWVTKVNRCPVCNMHIVGEDVLQKTRLAPPEGGEAPSLIGVTPLAPSRQRRRRARGENGVFELHTGTSSARLSTGSGSPPPSRARASTSPNASYSRLSRRLSSGVTMESRTSQPPTSAAPT